MPIDILVPIVAPLTVATAAVVTALDPPAVTAAPSATPFTNDPPAATLIATEAFDTALSRSQSRPEELAGSFFALRAQNLLNSTPPETQRAALSGLLIGAELAAARPYWLGQQIAILGADDLAQAYARALEQNGAPALIADGERMTLAGLTTAWRGVRDVE